MNQISPTRSPTQADPKPAGKKPYATGYIQRNGAEWRGDVIDEWGWPSSVVGTLENDELGKPRLKIDLFLGQVPASLHIEELDGPLLPTEEAR